MQITWPVNITRSVSPKEIELKRCLPCYWCGGKPIVTFQFDKNWPKYTMRCEGLKKPSHSGSCCNPYIYHEKHYADEKEMFSSFRKTWNAHQTGSSLKYINTDSAYYDAYKLCRDKFQVEYDRNNLEHELFWEKAYVQKVCGLYRVALGKVNGNLRKLRLALCEKKKKISSLQIEIDRLKAKVNKLENENNQIRSSFQG